MGRKSPNHFIHKIMVYIKTVCGNWYVIICNAPVIYKLLKIVGEKRCLGLPNVTRYPAHPFGLLQVA